MSRTDLGFACFFMGMFAGATVLALVIGTAEKRAHKVQAQAQVERVPSSISELHPTWTTKQGPGFGETWVYKFQDGPNDCYLAEKTHTLDISCVKR